MSKAMIVWSGVVALVVASMVSTASAVEYASEAGTSGDGIPDLIIDPVTGALSADPDGLVLATFVIDSEAGIFNGANSPVWSVNGILDADEDIQISMPINFDGRNPMTVLNDLGVGIIGASSLGSFSEADYLADLTIAYLTADGDSGFGNVIVGGGVIVPEPSSIILLGLGSLGLLFFRRRRRTA